MTSPLLDAFDASDGVVCLVGAGGKKTTMYAIAREHRGRIARSSTSHMYVYDENEVDRVVRAEDGVFEDAPGRVVAFAGKTDTPSRVGGLGFDQIQKLFQLFL